MKKYFNLAILGLIVTASASTSFAGRWGKVARYNNGDMRLEYNNGVPTGRLNHQYSHLEVLNSPFGEGGALIDATRSGDGSSFYTWKIDRCEECQISYISQNNMETARVSSRGFDFANEKSFPDGQRRTFYFIHVRESDGPTPSLNLMASLDENVLKVAGKINMNAIEIREIKGIGTIKDFQIYGNRVPLNSSTNSTEILVHVTNEEGMAYQVIIKPEPKLLPHGHESALPEIHGYRVNDVSRMPPELRSFVQFTQRNEIQKTPLEVVRGIGEPGGFGSAD